MNTAEHPQVFASCKEVEQAINDLISLLSEMGSQLSSSLKIEELNGEFQLFCTGSGTQTSVLLQIPLACVPLMDDYQFFIDDNFNVCAELLDGAVNPGAYSVMQRMLALYNVSDKFRKWFTHYPPCKLLYFREVLELLLAGQGKEHRSMWLSLMSAYADTSSKTNIEVMIKTFFLSRLARFSATHFEWTGVKTNEDTLCGFLPLAELANHQVKAPGFSYDPSNNALVICANAGSGEREVYIEYFDDMDPISTYMIYGFLDKSVEMVNSIATSFTTLKGTKVSIGNTRQHAAKDDLPHSLKHIDKYVPAEISTDGSLATISSLKIPPVGHGNIFRRVLSYCLGQILTGDGSIAETELSREVEHAEKQIIANNIEHWRQIKSDAQEAQNKNVPGCQDTLREIIDISDFYLEHLDDYVANINNTVDPKTLKYTSHSGEPHSGKNESRVLASIKQLFRHLHEMGAQFSPHMEVLEENGEIYIHYDRFNVEPKFLLDVPLAAVPLLDDYEYSLNQAYQLSAKIRKDAANPHAQPIMDSLVRFFNDSEKLLRWKQNFPLFNLCKFPSVLELLLSARSQSDQACFMDLVSRYCSRSTDIKHQAIIYSFFNARLMSYTQTGLRGSGIEVSQELVKGFLPAIDLINHHMKAPGFYFNTVTNNVQAIVAPGVAGREVFVRYSEDLDPLLTLCKYGFVDTSANWIYAIANSMTLRNGDEFKITNDSAGFNDDASEPELFLLHQQLPLKIKCSEQGVTVNQLIIPKGDSAGDLNKILLHVVTRYYAELGDVNFTEVVHEAEHLEQQLVVANLQYWHELKEQVVAFNSQKAFQDDKALSQVLDLCEFNIHHIEDYITATRPQPVIPKPLDVLKNTRREAGIL